MNSISNNFLLKAKKKSPQRDIEYITPVKKLNFEAITTSFSKEHRKESSPLLNFSKDDLDNK